MTYNRNAQNHKNVTCSCVPNCFYLFYEHGCQGGVLKIMKNDHFLVFLAVLVLFPKFWDRLKCSFYQN